MALTKQAKTLSKKQVVALLHYLSTRRHPLRNQVIFLLSIKAGLRAKEIAGLRWEMLMDASGELSGSISLSNDASKGMSGRHIPLNKQLFEKLSELHDGRKIEGGFGRGTLKA